jgi:NAD(P)H-dependent FMN reductase
MIKVAIIIGSTRPGRIGEGVGKWVYEIASKRTDASFELVDLAEVNLLLLDEPFPPAMHRYTKEHTKAWSEKVTSFDGFIFVTPEYNHGVPAALKNALDFLYVEWNNKVAGFIGYGNTGGARSGYQTMNYP